jgi:LysM repeat protein
MRLLPRLKRQDATDEVKEELAQRKRALKDLRTRRRVGTPTQREGLANVPEGAVVFQRGVQPAEQPEHDDDINASLDDSIDTPPEFLRKEADPADPAMPVEPDALDLDAEIIEPAADGALAGLEPEPAPAPAAGSDGDLLDIFRDEKRASADGNLASEVEDVSIDDLLGDLSSISQRLGVKPREYAAPVIKAVPLTPAVEVETEPSVKIEKVVPVPPVLEPVPDLVDDIDVGSLIDEEPDPGPPPPPQATPPLPQAPAPKRGVDGNTLLHVLFLGIALTAAGAFGASRIHRSGSVADAAPTDNGMAGVVLAVVETPGPTVTAIGTKAPTAGPTEVPTASPTDTPTPKPVRTRDPSIPPAYQRYQVEYGDSLTSMALGFGICPDHILWANDRDENTPLIAGEYLTISDGPGVIHSVQPGDTIDSIARLYNSTADAITGVAGNQLQTSDDLIVGDKIFVPGGIPQSALDLGAKADRMMSNPSSDGYVWPFYGPITTYYGEQRVGYVHNAIDIGGLGHYGSSVVAIADGVVAFVGNDSEYGNNVIVLHPDGSRSRYAHFSQTYVQEGESVSQGQALGALGCSGDSTGTHLHFEIWRNGKAVDPLLYLDA